MCPSARWITKGRGVTASSAARAGCVGSSQRDSSNPSITTGPSPSDARSRASVSSSDCRAGRLHVAVRDRRARPRQVHVRVDEPGQDGGAGKLHHPVGIRRVAAAHALNVAVVDQDPLAGLRMRKGVHARRAVEGPHVARLSQRGARRRASDVVHAHMSPAAGSSNSTVFPSWSSRPNDAQDRRRAGAHRFACARRVRRSPRRRPSGRAPRPCRGSPRHRPTAPRRRATPKTTGPTGRPSTPASPKARSHDAISSTHVSGAPNAMSRRVSTIGEIEA